MFQSSSRHLQEPGRNRRDERQPPFDPEGDRQQQLLSVERDNFAEELTQILRNGLAS
jgi:hypothetical protein